jgi:hypothetical protein
MKKFALAALIAVVAASPAVAAKKKKAPAAPVASADVNENSRRLAIDSLPIFLPSWSIPLYLQASGRKS